MTLDERPSIAKLRAIDAKQDLTTEELLYAANSLDELLEIAAAALDWGRAMQRDQVDDYKAQDAACQALWAALQKVRP